MGGGGGGSGKTFPLSKRRVRGGANSFTLSWGGGGGGGQFSHLVAPLPIINDRSLNRPRYPLRVTKTHIKRQILGPDICLVNATQSYSGSAQVVTHFVEFM